MQWTGLYCPPYLKRYSARPAAALDLQAQRDAAKAEATQQSEYIQSHGLTEFEMSRLQAELKAANKRIKKQLREIVELSKERERFALVIDSNKFPDTAAELIGQLRLDIVAAKERAEQAEADARRLAHIAKNVRIVSESENNLIEKYAK